MSDVTLSPGQSVTVTASTTTSSPVGGWDYSHTGTWILNQQGEVWPNGPALDLSPWVPVDAHIIRLNVQFASYWASDSGYIDASVVLGVPGGPSYVLAQAAGNIAAPKSRYDTHGGVVDLPNVNRQLLWGLQGTTLVFGANVTVVLIGVYR